MASFIEHWNSRQGGTVGLFGSHGASIVVHVTTDAEEDDPVITLTTMASGIWIGQPFPSAGTPWTERIDGMVAIGFVRGRRLAPKVWEIIVIYGPPILIQTASDAWEIELVAGVTSEHVFHDLDGKPIGSLVFDEIAPQTSPSHGGPTFIAKLPNGDQRLTVLPGPVSRGDKDVRARYVDGADRTTEVGSVRLSRLFPNLEVIALHNAFALRNRINSDTVQLRTNAAPRGSRDEFLVLASKGTLKFVQASARAEVGTLAGQKIDGQIWRVTLDLEHNPSGWQLERINTYRPNGSDVEVPVRKESDGKLFVENFRLYDEMDMTKFLGSWG